MFPDLAPPLQAVVAELRIDRRSGEPETPEHDAARTFEGCRAQLSVGRTGQPPKKTAHARQLRAVAGEHGPELILGQPPGPCGSTLRKYKHPTCQPWRVAARGTVGGFNPWSTTVAMLISALYRGSGIPVSADGFERVEGKGQRLLGCQPPALPPGPIKVCGIEIGPDGRECLFFHPGYPGPAAANLL